MKKLLLLTLLLAGCGGIKNTNPLLSLGGETDNSTFPFEASLTPWASQAPSAADNLFITNQISFKGLGSLAVHVTGMTASLAGDVGFAYGSATSFAGKTVTAWVFLPGEGAPSDSLPSYGEIYMKTGAPGFAYANSLGANLIRGGWTKLTWAPVANPTLSVINDSSGYRAPGFDPALVINFGIKVGVAGAATTFSYTGDYFIDSVEIQ